MKNTITFLGLVALSVLYLIEVDYSNIGILNWIAFGIIAITLIACVASIVSSFKKKPEQDKRR